MFLMRQLELHYLKQSIPLLSLVQQDGIELKKVGVNWVGKCPFHIEKTGSLVITPSKNLWHCFGCGAGGSPIDWVMKMQGMEFKQAVEWLRERYGGNLVEQQEIQEIIEFEKMNDIELMRWVIDYYHKTLNKEVSGRNYLNKRGLNDKDLIEKFSLGYVDRTLPHKLPSSRSQAGEEIRKRLRELGILRESNHEHFRECVIVPMFTETGEVGEIYGRKISPAIRADFP